jgi:hypothetical protein
VVVGEVVGAAVVVADLRAARPRLVAVPPFEALVVALVVLLAVVLFGSVTP